MLAVERRGEPTLFLQNRRCLFQCLLVGYSAGPGDLRNAAVDEEGFVEVSRWSYPQCATMVSRAIKVTDAARRSGKWASVQVWGDLKRHEFPQVMDDWERESWMSCRIE